MGMWERAVAWVRCPATGATHEYAKLRDTHGHRLCIHCRQVEGAAGRGSELPAHDDEGKGGAA